MRSKCNLAAHYGRTTTCFSKCLGNSGISGKNAEISRQKCRNSPPAKMPKHPAKKFQVLAGSWGTYQTFWPPPFHVEDPHPTRGFPDAKFEFVLFYLAWNGRNPTPISISSSRMFYIREHLWPESIIYQQNWVWVAVVGEGQTCLWGWTAKCSRCVCNGPSRFRNPAILMTWNCVQQGQSNLVDPAEWPKFGLLNRGSGIILLIIPRRIRL